MVVPDLLLLGEPWHPHTSQSLSLDWNVIHVLLIPPPPIFFWLSFWKVPPHLYLFCDRGPVDRLQITPGQVC